MHHSIEQRNERSLCEEKKIENIKNIKILEDYVLKLLLEHNNWFLGMDGGGHHHCLRSSMSQAGL